MKNRNTILVVDDDTAHRTMLVTLISGWGYEVTEAEDGSTATVLTPRSTNPRVNWPVPAPTSTALPTPWAEDARTAS